MSAKPLISIVMPSYNQAPFIGEAIESILSQSYPNKELIVIDGGSTDGTVQVIRAWESSLAYWISERDSGQVEALVRGIERSRGHIINWINSDDMLIEGALEQIAERFNGADALAGPVVYFGAGRRDEIRANKELNTRGLLGMHRRTRYHQPGIWLKGDLLRDNAREWLPFSLKFVFDWALYAHYFNRYPNVVYLSEPVARFRFHEHSKTVSQRAKFEQERLALLEQMLGDDEFSSYSSYLKHSIGRTKFGMRLSELEEVRTKATAAELAKLVMLHPASARRVRNVKRIAALARNLWI